MYYLTVHNDLKLFMLSSLRIRQRILHFFRRVHPRSNVYKREI